MKRHQFLASAILMLASVSASGTTPVLTPAPGAGHVNPDTRLSITFDYTPEIGDKGMIRIFDCATGCQVDSLDMSIPAGPTTPTRLPKPPYTFTPYLYGGPRHTNATITPGTPSGTAVRDTSRYQLNIIGGFTDGFHFYPIIVKGNRAEIYPHNNLLDYGKEYYVTIDKEVFRLPKGKFKGISRNDGWKFSTRDDRPAITPACRLTVSADGTADFNTVQGAIDYVPDNSDIPCTIFIRNGDYEELVYFRNKRNLTIEGENRDSVYIHYPNNEVFNPHPADVSTNEWAGTFPSRRAPFMADNCTDLTLRNFTVATTCRGQAEGLLVMGDRTVIEDVTVIGDGDALQVNGPVYLRNCRIEGGGDTVLGRGPAFFKDCTLVSRGPFAYIRNGSANHGNVFVDCALIDGGDGHSTFARTNGTYPHCEFVLIDCKLDNISPQGWSGLEKGDNTYVKYWEYNSTNLSDGTPVDISKRAKGSRQLTMPADSAIIRAYRDPSWVLGGWNPEKPKKRASK